MSEDTGAPLKRKRVEPEHAGRKESLSQQKFPLNTSTENRSAETTKLSTLKLKLKVKRIFEEEHEEEEVARLDRMQYALDCLTNPDRKLSRVNLLKEVREAELRRSNVMFSSLLAPQDSLSVTSESHYKEKHDQCESNYMRSCSSSPCSLSWNSGPRMANERRRSVSVTDKNQRLNYADLDRPARPDDNVKQWRRSLPPLSSNGAFWKTAMCPPYQAHPFSLQLVRDSTETTNKNCVPTRGVPKQIDGTYMEKSLPMPKISSRTRHRSLDSHLSTSQSQEVELRTHAEEPFCPQDLMPSSTRSRANSFTNGMLQTEKDHRYFSSDQHYFTKTKQPMQPYASIPQYFAAQRSVSPLQDLSVTLNGNGTEVAMGVCSTNDQKSFPCHNHGKTNFYPPRRPSSLFMGSLDPAARLNEWKKYDYMKKKSKSMAVDDAAADEKHPRLAAFPKAQTKGTSKKKSTDDSSARSRRSSVV